MESFLGEFSRDAKGKGPLNAREERGGGQSETKLAGRETKETTHKATTPSTRPNEAANCATAPPPNHIPRTRVKNQLSANNLGAIIILLLFRHRTWGDTTSNKSQRRPKS